MHQESAADLTWSRRRMARRLELMLRTDTGLNQGEALWMDGREMLLWTPERLQSGGRYLVRVDLGAMGESVDVTLTVARALAVRARGGGTGYLHAGHYTLDDDAARPHLDEVLRRLGPGGDDTLSSTRTAQSYHPRALDSVSNLASMADRGSSATFPADRPKGRDGIADAIKSARETRQERPAPTAPARRSMDDGGAPVVKISGDQVLVRFSRIDRLGRFLTLEPGVLRCRLSTRQPLYPGMDVRLGLRAPGIDDVRSGGRVMRAGNTWMEVRVSLDGPTELALQELMERAARTPPPAPAAPPRPSVAPVPPPSLRPPARPAPEPPSLRVAPAPAPAPAPGRPSVRARLSTASSPTVLVTVERWEALREVMTFNGLALSLHLQRPTRRPPPAAVFVELTLPGQVQVRFSAQVEHRAGGSEVVSTRLPQGAAAEALIKHTPFDFEVDSPSPLACEGW
jgi:hypothetical protein